MDRDYSDLGSLDVVSDLESLEIDEYFSREFEDFRPISSTSVSVRCTVYKFDV